MTSSFASAVLDSMNRLLPTLERASIIEQSINNRCVFIKASDRADALAVINRVAPEHLELCVDDPESMLSEIEHAGAIFMPPHT